MSGKLAEIDWFMDGFQVRLEGEPFGSVLPGMLSLFSGGLAGLAYFSFPLFQSDTLMVSFAALLCVSLASGLFSAAARDRRPVHVLELTPHRLLVHRGDDVVFEAPLAEIQNVAVELGTLHILHDDERFQVDASGHTHGSLEKVEQAVLTAWKAQQHAETEAEEAERKRALAALAALRGQSART